jgi:hypothetical protein
MQHVTELFVRVDLCFQHVLILRCLLTMTLSGKRPSPPKRALLAGVPLIELQFPPLANMATAALNQLLDQNRDFTREFLRPFTPLHKPERINVVFPDYGEARLAQKTWGDVPFTLRSIPEKKEQGAPSYVRKRTVEGTGRGVEEPGLIVVVNPGFNISEWINMEALEGADPIVLVNGDLDKVRGVSIIAPLETKFPLQKNTFPVSGDGKHLPTPVFVC